MNKEELIKHTAKDLFFNKGYLHATTQEIADAAGVNRALINYYFRSRDQLFEIVYKEAVNSLKEKLDAVIYSTVPFREKIEHFIDAYMIELQRYPYRESFLITEICSKNFALKQKEKSKALSFFQQEIADEMEKGNIAKTNPAHFFLNLTSLMAHPIIMSPLLKKVLGYDNVKYDQLLAERKQTILDIIFK